MSRDYETPEHYAGPDYEAWEEEDRATDNAREDRAEAALRRWEDRRDAGPYDDPPEPEGTLWEDAA